MSKVAGQKNTVIDWDSRFANGDTLIHTVREDQLGLLRRVGDLWRTQLEQWEDLANAEESLKREYGGRYLFELLQNADDAMTDKLEVVGPNAFQVELNRVTIILTDDSILVANDGLPFGSENTKALCRLYNSTKSASKQIGHKGIGFKSVLEVTDNPEVYSSDYAFGFDRREFAAEVRRITKNSNVDPESLQVLRVPFTRRLSRLPATDQQHIQALLNDEYATVIRLPLKSTVSADSVAAQIRATVRPELLLFLESTKQLLIQMPDGETTEYWYKTENRQELFTKRPFQKVNLWSRKNGRTELESCWLLLASGKMPIPDPGIVKDLGRAWEEVKAVKCAVAFRLTSDGKALDTNQPEQKFSVYFPTEEQSGLHFLLNADLYIEAARKDIRLNDFNKWLAELMALYVATTGANALRSQFPGDPAIVDVLAPLRKPGREFSSFFYDKYLLALSQTAFVPDEQGGYHVPENIRLSPKGTDSAHFRRLFPPDCFNAHVNWVYPLLEVEKRERDRHDPFLLLEELGSREITIGEMAVLLGDGPPKHLVKEKATFLQFLVNWWNQLVERERKQLKLVLEKCAIIPTQHGWQAPTSGHIFQANLRDEAEIDVPVGFHFALVPLEAYGSDRAYDGYTVNFLTAIGVGRYQAVDILRQSIFPVMTSQDQFKRLLNENHEAVYVGYQILKAYRDREISGVQFKDIRTQVFVPCHHIDQPDKLLWKPAYQVYFTQYWIGNDDLEVLYGSFSDAYFLSKVPQFFPINDEGERESWFDFFTWLGVNQAPRLLSGKNTDLWNINHKQHALANHSRWHEYVSIYEHFFNCPKVSHSKPNPNRRFQENYALHHFEEIVRAGDVRNHLYRLFRLLGVHWDLYKPYLTIKLRCRYKQCYEPVGSIPSYFFYCLKQLPWLAAERWGVLEPVPYLPTDIWNLGDDIRPEVRHMLPSLPDEFRREVYFDMCADLLRRKVEFSDYLALLKRLPDICSIQPPDGVQVEIYKWQRAVRAVFNWLGQAMHNSLERLGEAHWLARPDDLLVLAYRDETPAYVSVSDPFIVHLITYV